MTKTFTTIRWRWIIVGGVVAEIALLPTTLGLGFLTTKVSLPDWLAFSAYGAVMFLVLLPVSVWAAPKAGSAFLLNGTLIGLLAALIFLPFLIMAPLINPVHETINEILKVAGGAMGGLLAGRRTTSSSRFNA